MNDDQPNIGPDSSAEPRQQSNLINKSKLAERLNVSTRSVDFWIAQRKIPFFRLGQRMIRFDWNQVQRHLAEHYQVKAVDLNRQGES